VGSFNWSDRHIFFLNILVGVLILYFLALSIGDVARLHVAGNVLPPETAAVPRRLAGLGTGARARIVYDAIVRRDIFNLAPAPETAPAENENLTIKLVGTSQLSRGKPYAIIEDQGGNQSLYRVGEDVPGAGKLLEVAQDRAVILHNGHKVAVAIPRETPSPGEPLQPMRGRVRRFPGRMPPPHGSVGGVRRLGTNRFVLDRRTVENNLNNMAPLFTQIRATPNVEGGVSNGFLLSEIQPGSIFQQIGLQDGDLLKSVNGQSVGDPGKAMALLQSLQSQLPNQRLITLDVVRNRLPTHLSYTIR
jgi:general secretion pathway protein C